MRHKVKFIVGGPSVSTRATGQNLPAKVGSSSSLFFLVGSLCEDRARLSHPLPEERCLVSRKPKSEFPDTNLFVFLNRVSLRRQNPDRVTLRLKTEVLSISARRQRSCLVASLRLIATVFIFPENALFFMEPNLAVG